MAYTYNNSTLRGKQRVRFPDTRGQAVFQTDAFPSDDVGSTGDLSINTTNWVLHGPKEDTWTDSAARSISKTRIFFNSTRSPLDAEGNDGDVWIFTDQGGLTLNFWQKSSGVWSQMLQFQATSIGSSVNSSSGGGDGGDGGGGE